MNSIRTNPANLTAQRIHGQNTKAVNKSVERIATSIKINRGGDDPAGLINSENLRSVLVQLEAETRVAQRIDSVSTVAEGALNEASDALVEAQALAVANANTAGMSDAEREANQMQIDSALASVDRISRTTNFNGEAILDGTAQFTVDGETLNIDSVAPTAIDQIDVGGGEMHRLSDVGSGQSLNTVTGDVSKASQVINAAISRVSTMRGEIGAFQRNTIQSSIRSKQVAIENVAAANSQIRDTDYAKETSNLTRENIKKLASVEAMRMTNSSSASVLKLVGG